MLHRSRARAAAVPLRRYLHTLMFSGQGTQHPGMAKDLYAAFPAARRVLDAVDDELGFSLTSLMFNQADVSDSGDTLRCTSNAQPAIFAHSMAVLACLVDEGLFVGMPSLDGPKNSGKCIANGEGSSQANVGLLRHSLGEFSVLPRLLFSHAARIVRDAGRKAAS